MRKAIIYIHGKGGNAAEAEHYRALLDAAFSSSVDAPSSVANSPYSADVFGFDYKAETPWEAETEFRAYLAQQREHYDSVSIIANSIGAYFTLMALTGEAREEGAESSVRVAGIEAAYLISPVVDMAQLIENMMVWAGVTAKELEERGEIETNFGETLSWRYYCYAKEHPADWSVPTHILYAASDNMTSRPTIEAFAERIGAELTVMENGEHWFHTEEQMAFLDEWLLESMKSEA